MSKGDAPALRMRVENLRLVPAFPYDQERLASYRNGSELRVVPTQPKNEKLNRKFHAILNRVLADCRTPWKTTDEAKDSLKMALGVTRQTMPVGGEKPFRYPGSLAELDEPEFIDFYEGAIAILHKITGVDPETMNAESAHVGDDEPETSAPPADAAAAEPVAPVPTVAADHLPAADAADLTGAGGTQAREEPVAPSAPATPTDADRDWLLSAARQVWAGTGKGEQDLVVSISADLKKTVPAEIGKLTRDRFNSIVKHCKSVCFGETAAGEALEIIAGIVGVEPKEIVATQEGGK